MLGLFAQNGQGASPRTAAIVTVLLLCGCVRKPVPFEPADVAAQNVADQTTIFATYEKVEKPLTLSDTIARVLRHNLERNAKMMEEALALDQLDVDRFDLLPKAVAGAGYVNRSDHATVTSRDAITLQPALADPYYSLDRDRQVADLTASWNILDFGVSWFNAHQNADRALIAMERRRKTVNNLIVEVRFAYWRAAAAQQLAPSVDAAIADAEKALANSAKVEQEQLHDPVDALRYQKGLLETLRQLEALQQQLSSAQAELNVLINLPPNTRPLIAKHDAQEMTLPEWKMPIGQMEDAALLNSPDLREQMYQSRIAADEVKKAILRLLPGISFSAGPQFDTNSFLMNKAWTEASARLTFNLFNLLSGPAQIKLAHANEDVVTAKRLAVHMAALAEVHVAWNQYRGAARQYARADQLFTVENRLSTATANRQESDAQSVLERINNQTSAITAELRRYDTFAQAQAALARMEAAIGANPVPPEAAGADIGTLSDAIARRMEQMDRGDLPPPPGATTSTVPAAAPMAAISGGATPDTDPGAAATMPMAASVTPAADGATQGAEPLAEGAVPASSSPPGRAAPGPRAVAAPRPRPAQAAAARRPPHPQPANNASVPPATAARHDASLASPSLAPARAAG
jgi:outer membrane protein TolC